MKNNHRLLIALALVLGTSAPALAQGELPTNPALERAIVVEEIEHDRPQALVLFRELVDDETLSDALRRHASLRLGLALALLGEVDAAREALARAAVGDDEIAARALAAASDPGQDGERARLLRAEARHWIERLPTRLSRERLWGDTTMRRLLWIGKPAVPELVRAIESRRGFFERDRSKVMNQTALLWRIGGPEAEAYLDSLRKDEDQVLRLAVVWGLRGDSAREDAMVAVAQRYLLDPDPRGEVVIAALGHSQDGFHSTWKRYDIDAILALVDSPVKEVRLAALKLIRREWFQLRHAGDQAGSMQRLTPRLERALDDLHPEVVEQASLTFQSLALYSAASRALLVRRLPSASSDFHLGVNGSMLPRRGEAAIAGLLPMLHKLGPASVTATSLRDQSVSRLVAFYRGSLGPESLELMLEVLRLGYDPHNLTARWIEENCGHEEAQRVLGAMALEPKLDSLLSWVAEFELAEGSWPSLAAIGQRLEAVAPDYDWSEYRAERYHLLAAMGRCATPAALAYIIEQLGESAKPILYEAAVHGLLMACLRRPEEDVLAALRRALLVDSSGESTRMPPDQTRELVFARLIQLGDRRAIDLLPRANEKGMSFVTLGVEYGGGTPFANLRRHGLSWLWSFERQGDELHFFHGFDDATLASIWDSLLSRPRGEAWNDSWEGIGQALARGEPDGVLWRHLDTSPRLLEVWAKHWQQRSLEQDPLADGNAVGGLKGLLEVERAGVTKDEPARAALAQLRQNGFDSPSAHIRRLAIELLPTKLDESKLNAVHAALTDPDRQVASAAISRTFANRQPVDRGLFLRVLGSPNSRIRRDALRNLAPRVEGQIVDEVKALLSDASASVRVAACVLLASEVDAGVVPDLLRMLTDADDKVRAAAADALRAIRFYHDEKAHWDRIFAGTELSAGGAAEALLKQAGAQSPREVRLLALRSLGSLGVAQTLPFLIEWSTDSDGEIASTARAAITCIHAGGD